MGKGVSGYTEGTGQLFSKSFFGSPNYINTPLKTPKVADASSYLDTVFGGVRRLNFEDGGLIGMQTGGLTAEQILRQQGLTADDTQLALFQAFDPTGIQKATEGAGQSLLGMTGGQGLASAGGGFGAQQSAISQMVEQGQKSLEQQIQDEQKAFESQTLGTAAQIVAGGGEFGTYGGSGTTTAQTQGGGTTSISGAPANPDDGDTFQALNGKVYEWDANAGSWFEVDQG